MTENNKQLTRVVPEGKDVHQLTVAEIDAISRKLGCSALHAIATADHPLRWAAFARLAHAWAKRADHTAQLADFEALTVEELLYVIGDDDSEEETPAAPPSTSAPESQ